MQEADSDPFWNFVKFRKEDRKMSPEQIFDVVAVILVGASIVILISTFFISKYSFLKKRNTGEKGKNTYLWYVKVILKNGNILYGKCFSYEANCDDCIAMIMGRGRNSMNREDEKARINFKTEEVSAILVGKHSFYEEDQNIKENDTGSQPEAEIADAHTKEIFFNRADVLYGEQIVCDNCFERAVFHMKDSTGYEFSIGLSTIIECLIAAVQNGDLPKLPESWIHNIEAIYYIPDEKREIVSYRD